MSLLCRMSWSRWRASISGPTLPNRFFMMAASSGGLDHSPSIAQIAEWMTVDGFTFEHGSLFDALSRAQRTWRIYHGDHGPLSGSLPVAGGLAGILPWDPHPYSKFAADIATAAYPVHFTLIEPNYGMSPATPTAADSPSIRSMTCGPVKC